jgi:hypothetical protein
MCVNDCGQYELKYGPHGMDRIFLANELEPNITPWIDPKDHGNLRPETKIVVQVSPDIRIEYTLSYYIKNENYIVINNCNLFFDWYWTQPKNCFRLAIDKSDLPSELKSQLLQAPSLTIKHNNKDMIPEIVEYWEYSGIDSTLWTDPESRQIFNMLFIYDGYQMPMPFILNDCVSMSTSISPGDDWRVNITFEPCGKKI